jgi:quercetin dioxygenase-like cupin family protein
VPFIDLSDLEEKEKLPGYKVKIIHSDNMTLAFWKIKAGAELSAHAHLHEQVTIVTKGSFELTVDGTPHVIKPDNVFIIPPNTPHSARAITDSEVTDAFYPVREDFK